MSTKNKFIKYAFAALAVASAVICSLPVHAEGNEEVTNETTSTVQTVYPTIDDRLANLTVKYFDDEEETIPITGAEFTVYQVAKIGNDLDNNGAYVPLDESIDFVKADPEKVDDYEVKVVDAYKNNPEIGYKNTLAIGKDGTCTFKNIPAGAYLITESKTMRYHIRPKSFVVSAPETTEDGKSWNFDVVVNPKQILAGDLEVTKIVKGKIAKQDKTYTLALELPNGNYKATLPDKTETTVKNGDRVTIKGGQTLYVYDLPHGSDYKVTEVEANSVNFKTTYTKNEGKIEAKSSAKVEVVNDSTSYDTGSGYQMLYYMIGGGAALAVLVLLIVTGKKKKAEK